MSNIGNAVRDAKKVRQMLRWAQRITANGFGSHVRVANWNSESWLNGLALCAIVSHVRPDLVDFDDLEFKTQKERLRAILDVAKSELNVDSSPIRISEWCRRKLVTKEMILPYFTSLYKALKRTAVPSTGQASVAVEKARRRRTQKLLKASSEETKAELARMFQVLDHKHRGTIFYKQFLAFVSRQPAYKEAKRHGFDIMASGIIGNLAMDAKDNANLEIDFSVFCQCILHFSDLIAKADRRRRASNGRKSGWGTNLSRVDTDQANRSGLAVSFKLPQLLSPGSTSSQYSTADSAHRGRQSSKNTDTAQPAKTGDPLLDDDDSDDFDDSIAPGPFGWKFEKKKKKKQLLDLEAYAGAAFRTRNFSST